MHPSCRLAPPGPEVYGVYSVPVGTPKVTRADSYPDLLEILVEDAGPVAGASHPSVEAVVRRTVDTRASGDVLPDRVVPVARRRVAESLQTGREGLAFREGGGLGGEA